MPREELVEAKSAKKGEFYTQYGDIEKEMNAYIDYDKDVFRGKTILLPCDDPEWSNFTKYFAQNFERFGIKKLVSTSYAPNSQNALMMEQPTLFETEHPRFDSAKSSANGRIFTLDRDRSGDKRINVDDLDWEYLDGDGDFRSREVTKHRDEADIIITNPPFYLFREFMSWITTAKKQFSVIGNMNAITYKEIFPLIKDNRLWLGESIHSGDREFEVPRSYPLAAASCREDENGRRFVRVKGVRWFTNIEHGRRHQPLPLMTTKENLKFSKHAEIKGRRAYLTYANAKAIEVPYTDAIPSDHKGLMGVPISFLDKYSPEQFEIVRFRHGDDGKDLRLRNGTCPYFRILIRHLGPSS